MSNQDKGSTPVSKVAVTVGALVNAFTASNAVITKAQHAQLPALTLALKDVKPVNGVAFEAEWKEPLRAELVKAGFAERSLVTATSRLKVCVIALTHVSKRADLAPEADAEGGCTEGLQRYVERARDTLKEMGVYEGSKARAGANAKGQGSAGRAEGSGAARTSKGVSMTKEGAALLVAGTAERAQTLLQIMEDADMRAQFDRWAKFTLTEA